jgi:hypothetical protein
MAIKVPNQENRAFTNYTFGDTANVNQQRLLQNLIGLKEQRETRKFREKQFEASEDYKYETLGLKKREISGAEAFRAKQLAIREEDKIRQDKIRLEDLGFKKQLQTTSDEIKKIAIENQTSTNLYRQNMLGMKKTELNRQSQSLYGGNIFDDKGDMFEAVIKKEGKFIRNPKIPVGVKVDVKEQRIIPVTEIAMNQKIANQVEEKLGIAKALSSLEKQKQSSAYVLDPLLTDAGEGSATLNPLTWGKAGFDEEEALDNLIGKQNQWATATEMMKSRDKTNPERKAVLSAYIKLRDELKGEKYESATAWYALEGNKYGKIRDGLSKQLDGYINALK